MGAIYKHVQVRANAGWSAAWCLWCPNYVEKKNIISVWPTALSYEGIIWTIANLHEQCRYSYGLDLYIIRSC